MYIYVAGPYSTGRTSTNVRNAILAGDRILQLGHSPFVPHITHFWDFVTPHSYEEWMDWCLEWVRRCDAVLRISGESPGAEREVELARHLGMPVYFSTRDIPSPEEWKEESVVQ